MCMEGKAGIWGVQTDDFYTGTRLGNPHSNQDTAVTPEASRANFPVNPHPEKRVLFDFYLQGFLCLFLILT